MKTTQYIWSTSTTQPTSGWITFTNGTFISKNDCIVGNYYLWIKAIDNENNTYITHSNAFSIINTNITITPNTTSWTNKDITGTVAYSNSILINRKAGYGTTLEEAQKNISTNTSTKIIAPENGYFYAEATDSMGNKVYESLQITKIDKIAPSKPEIKEIGGAYDILIQFTPKDNENGSGIDNVATDNGELTSSDDEYSLKISSNGTSTITIYDKAGNSVSFKYTIQFFAKTNDQCTAFTGGWGQNYFKNAYGNIPGITYKYENGVFAIYALPQSGYGRLGTWYTNNSIDLSNWQYIHTVSSLDVSSTGTWNLWLDGTKVVSKTYNDGEYNDGIARWVRLDYEIKPEDKSKHIIIGSDGLDTQTVRGYFAQGFLSKIE